MSSHTEQTTEWYVNWLNERHPEWTDEQRLEIATGFAVLQLPPARLGKDADEDDSPEDKEPTPEETRDKKRKAERLLHGYVGNLLKEAGE